MTGDPADIPIPEPLRAQYRVSFIRFQSPTAALFEGVDPEHGHTVLVKVMRPDPTASPADRQRVRRELQKLVQVRHPTLVPILDLGEEGDLTWVVRPFVVGETLSERIASRGRLSDVEAATLGLHLAAGLGELHRHGLLHRDLRPGHVLLGQDGGVYLIDAGLGRTFVAPDGRALVGCPGYAAPEAILGRLMSFRSDLYGLGAVLYEALSGMPPYMALDPRRMMQLQCEADPEPLDPSVPQALTRLVATLLARDPRERPMSAQIVERQLEPMVPSIPPSPMESDIELGERTVMTDSSSDYMDSGMLQSEPPASAFMPPATPPAPPQPAPPPQRQQYKQTMMGMAPEMPAMAAEQQAQAAVASEGGLDFEDVVDTNQNEASRVFGIPATSPNQGGSAIPPLAAVPPQAPAFGPPPGADPKSGPRMAPPPYGEPPPQQPGPGPSGMYPQGQQDPMFDVPVSHTVAMDGPPPGAFGAYPSNPGMPPGQPMQMQPMQMQPMQPQMQMQPGQMPPHMQQQPMQQPMQQQWSPYGGPMSVPPGPGYVAPAPAPPAKSGGALPWIIGFVVLVSIAGGAGFLAARARRTTPVVTAPTLPATTPTQPTMPETQPTAVDAGALLATADVPSMATPDVAMAAAIIDASQVLAAEPDTGTPVAVVVDAGTMVAIVDAGAPATPVAPSPTPTPSPARPVVRVATPRPNTVRPVPRPTTAADAGVAVTPLNDALRRQDWAAARRLLGEHLRAHPSDAAAHAQLGYVLDRLGDSNGALNEYRSATRLDRRNTRYLHRLADLQTSTGDRAGAIATLQQILRINPQEPAARARLDQLQPH